jgi:hypothetical protein
MTSRAVGVLCGAEACAIPSDASKPSVRLSARLDRAEATTGELLTDSSTTIPLSTRLARVEVTTDELLLAEVLPDLSREE